MNTAADMKGRDFLKLLDCTPQEIEYLLGLASELKAKKKSRRAAPALRGQKRRPDI